MKQIPLREICYYLFFGLLLMAKGLGLYDGQSVFKVILMAAACFWACKMLLTPYHLKEILVIGLLLLLGAASYYFSGDKAALVAMMVITGMKDVPVKRVYKLGFGIWTVTFWGTVAASLLGLRESLQFVHRKSGLGFIIRDSLGMTHPNVLHISYLVFIALYFLVLEPKGKALRKAVCAAFLGSVFIFMYSLSYTGFLFTTAYLVLVVYLNAGRRKTPGEKVFLQCLMPVCVFTAILGPVLLKGRVFDIVNKLVNTRFELSRHYLTSLRPALFGTGVNIEGNYTIDCSYVHCLYYYGIVLFAVFVAGFFLLIRNLLVKGRDSELAMTLGLIAAGFTEPFLFNFSFKNLILVLLGEMLFAYLAPKSRLSLMDKEIQLIKKEFTYPWKAPEGCLAFWKRLTEILDRHKRQICIGAVIGMAAGILLGTVCVHAEPYVVVNKSVSDRVGKKGDYQIYGELTDEIKEHSLKIRVDGDDTKVFVLSGSIVRYEEIREKVTLCIGCVLAGIATAAVILYLQDRNKNDQNFDAG